MKPFRESIGKALKQTAIRWLAPALLAMALTPVALAEGVTLRLAAGSDGGESGRWTKAKAQEWAKACGNKVEYISSPTDSTQTLQQFQQYWAAKSPDVDVYMIDVIWPGIVAPHAVDLKKYFTAEEISAHFPRIVTNNTVNDQLVAIPFFTDAGMLYYRTDLLAKYGFKEPPKTWEELAAQAASIQAGERKEGKADFQGFVFQGKASESVTCNAVEWIYSYGGGTIIDSDKKITINDPNSIKALAMAKSWVGTISPKGVTTYGEEEARNVWQSGNAAFMRNWPYAYALGADPKSPIAGKFDISVLPKGGDNGKNAAALGGWQLMVSKYSKHPDAAAELVKYLTSPEAQKQQAVQLSMLPTLRALYSDPDVLAKNPWFKNVEAVLENAVARPSTIAAANYNLVSTAFFQNVNKTLSGGSTPENAVQQVERVAKRAVK
ncbi:MAG TPA: ABC transporter substrate-binding protein [Chthoniobacterales bacterium]